jgi:hypothetical protein
MAVVNPLLAAWDPTGVLRLYEYAGGAFTLTGSLGGLTQANTSTGVGATTVPFLYWMGEDAACAVVRELSNSSCQGGAISPAGVLNNTVIIGASADLGPFRATGFANRLMFVERVAWPFNGANLASRHGMSTAGILSATGSVLTLSEHHKKVWEFSPDGTKTIWRTTDNETRFGISADPFNVSPSWTLQPDPGFLIDIDLAAWAHDNKTLVIADVTAERAQSWIYEDSAWAFAQELDLPPGVMQFVKMSGDTRKMAISSLDGGTYYTRIYRRTGSFFIVEQTLVGIGRLIDFTADGVLLVDCANQVAYSKQSDESFALAVGVMVNIPVGIRAQALSLGRTDAFGWPTLYDDAVAEFSDNVADLDNLKLTLLTSSAVFDAAHDTMSDVTNATAWEVQTGGWPAGGVPLTGVSTLAGDGFFALLCDTVSQIIIETGVTFRNLVIYDATNDSPLIFINLLNDRSYAKNRELLIDFRGGEFLRFSV